LVVGKQEVTRITNNGDFLFGHNNKEVCTNKQNSFIQPELATKQTTGQGSSSGSGFKFWYFKCDKLGHQVFLLS